jgi:hypothetical protein
MFVCFFFHFIFFQFIMLLILLRGICLQELCGGNELCLERFGMECFAYVAFGGVVNSFHNGVVVLGCMGIQDVFRGEVVAILGEIWYCALRQDNLVARKFAFHYHSSP